MTKSRAPRRRPGARAVLLLGIGVALGFSAFHALRTLDLSDAEPTSTDAAGPTTTITAVPGTAAPTTEAPTTVPSTAPPTTAAPTTVPPTTAPPTTVPGPPTYRT